MLLEEEDGKVLSSLPKKPVDKETFLKLCDERRKFPILYKAEFQVYLFFRYNNKKLVCMMCLVNIS